MLFMNPQQHEDAAHGGGRGPEGGEGYLSADWAVLLVKDNDKPGFIVRSCSLLTAYDEYLQKGRGGNHEIVCGFFIFFQQVFFQRRGQSDSHPQCLQPSVYTQLAEALRVYMYTHISPTSALTCRKLREEIREVKG